MANIDVVEKIGATNQSADAGQVFSTEADAPQYFRWIINLD